MIKKEFKKAADIFLKSSPQEIELGEKRRKHVERPKVEEPKKEDVVIMMNKPQKKIKKTKRFTALMTPELFRGLKEKSKKEGISMNDIITQLLEAYVRQS